MKDFSRKREPGDSSGVKKGDMSEAARCASEAELIRRAQHGDAQAFGVLVTQYHNRVYNTMYRMTHSHADALDLTQTAFLRAYEAIGRFDGRASFYTWLFRIAVNLATSHHRSRRRRRCRRTLSLHTDDERPVFEPASLPGESGEEVLARQEQQERVAAALAQLEPPFRAAVVLKDIEDFDYATIAEILEVPIGTVRSRIHRGREMLRKLLTAEGEPLDTGG